MKKIIVKSIKYSFVYSGLYRLFISLKKQPRILFWHGVDNIINKEIEAESFAFTNFKKQIQFLKKHYSIISLKEFYTRMEENSFYGNEIVLTFDDGYLNNLTQVAPYLDKMDIPFNVFISTNNISNNELFPTSIVRLIVLGADIKEVNVSFLNLSRKITNWESRKKIEREISKAIKSCSINDVNLILKELKENISEGDYKYLINKFKSVIPMNWDDVRSLSRFKNVTIGSHCLDHICCHGNQKKEDILRQILESKMIIEKEINKECEFFAYPNGDFTSYSNECVAKAGYLMGLSTQRIKINKDFSQKYCMPRLAAPQDLIDFKFSLSIFPI